ncbi:LysR family transcriptional regulator [Variovorax defluvii]|uniref:LysR family transcriptional regulator n=1 Tax=Variovorax defluvii TaxID=913761 RepID=A0ABP8IGG4_9BURK
MDRHQAIQCFCRVVETGSFAAASRDLDCSRALVTKAVQSLEAWTSSQLLQRTTRSMQLTAAGEQFYAYCKRVLVDTEDTLNTIRDAGRAPAGRMVVATPVSLTLGWLGSHLLDFAAAHPQVQLEVRLDDRPVDLVRDGVDVALRGKGKLEDSSLVATPIGDIERSVVAAAEYWRRRGKARHPRELRPAECLPYLLGSDGSQWQFFGPDGEHFVHAASRLRTDNSLFLLEALRRGEGVGLVPRVLLARAPELEPALEEYRTEPRTLYALYSSRRYQPARVTALVRFLKARLTESATLPVRAA